MLEYDGKQGIMSWKIVCCGPALSGKTTNLLALLQKEKTLKKT